MADRNELSAFLRLFADRHQTFVRSRNSTTWRATSQFHYLTDEELISSLDASSSVRRAFGSMEKTYFVAIQVDASKSATAFQTVQNLHKQLNATGLQPKSFYIEELDLWQIFVFFAQPVSSQKAVATTRIWLEKNWFTIDAEAASILPSEAPLQIPLQATFTWLNDELGPVVAASEMSFQSAVSMFMQDLRTNATDFATFQAALTEVPSIVQSNFAVVVDETIDFTPVEETVQTVESKPVIDYSPDTSIYTDAPEAESLFQVSDESADEFVINGSVQTEEPPSEIASFQPAPDSEERCLKQLSSPPGSENTTFDQADQVVQSVQSEEFSTHPVPSVNFDQSPDQPSEEELVVDQSEPDFGQFNDNPIFAERPHIGEKDLSPPVEIATEEPGTQSEDMTSEIALAVPNLLFIHKELDERAPPQIEVGKSTEHPTAPRKSSARDGPGQNKKPPTTAQKARSNSDSFEQLTLPFGTNTS